MKGKLAIISTNRAKYSETFIDTQIKALPFPVVLYTDGYFPSYISLDRGKSTRKLKKNWLKSSDEIDLLKRSFQKENIQVVLAQYGPSGVAVVDVCKMLNIPLIVHFHGYDAYRKDILQSYGKQYPTLFKESYAVIAVSKDMKQRLQQLGCSEKKIHHIPCGINETLFSPSSRKNIHTEDFISCGRFVPKKGAMLTLRSFHLVVQEFPRSRLIFIGDGILQNKVKEMSKKLGLEKNVIFKGICSQKEVAMILQNAFALVQHSVTTNEGDSEGTPLSIMEAGATSLPVIATKHGGIKDVIIDGKTGFLVEEYDIQTMAKKMLFLLENRKLASHLGEEGRKVILKKFTKEVYINKLVKLIESSVDGN